MTIDNKSLAHGPGKFYGIDVVRGVATCFVVLAHTTWQVGEPRNLGVVPFNHLFDGLFVSVDFFFVLSGFLITWVHWRDIGNPGRVGNYFQRRLTRIYPVYWIVLTFYVLSHLYHPAVSRPVDVNLKSLITSYLIIPNDGRPILGVAWTLFYEVFCYIVFAMILCVGRKGLVAVALWAVAIVACYLSDAPKQFPTSFFLNPYNLQFLAGIATAYYMRTLRLPAPRLLMVLGFAAFLTLVALGPDKLTNNNLLAMRCIFGVLASVIIAGLVESERSGLLRIPKWMQDFGAGSYSIYLTHPLIVPVLLVYSQTILRYFSPEAATVTIVVLAIGFGYVFHRIVELPVTRWVQRVTMSSSAPTTAIKGKAPADQRAG